MLCSHEIKQKIKLMFVVNKSARKTQGIQFYLNDLTTEKDP